MSTAGKWPINFARTKSWKLKVQALAENKPR